MVIVINLWLMDLAEWTRMISRFNCPITVNCPITLSDYSCTEWLVTNEAANAPIKFEEIIIAMINGFIIQLHN